MMKKSVIKRTGVPSARKLGAKPKRRLWLGVNEGLYAGVSTMPNPDPNKGNIEAWPGLPRIAQQALIAMHEEQDRGCTIRAEIVAALLAFGEYFSCNLDARTEEGAEL